eukprot:TRINITY_DN4626_c3_g1_i1.p1 TRINITY_DN4626_c3_g1~~TRINITY_DN4626_c3_g1_i1.p1  ORF type:complete len:959 (+),score=137.05 TRINITY_DN4626_c3_g1_i1:77-2878(+)
MACVQNPVPHHLGACVTFTLPPVFLLPVGVVTARLQVVEGTGNVFGRVDVPETAVAEEGQAIIAAFTGCGVDKEGTYVLSCEYKTSDNSSNSVVQTAPFEVARVYFPPSTSASTVITLAGCILCVMAPVKQTIPAYIEKLQKGFESARIHALPLPAKTLEEVQRKIISSIVSGITGGPVLEALSEREKTKTIERFKSKIKKDNGSAALKIPALRGSQADLSPEILTLALKTPQNVYPSVKGAPSHFHFSSVEGTLNALGCYINLTPDTILSCKKISIVAMYLQLPSHISIPHGSISIKAYVVILPSGGCTIDVSGDNGGPTPNGIAEPGQNGSHGMPGGNGGMVSIISHSVQPADGCKTGLVINANGGNGSNGQHGGSGIPGDSGETPGSHGRKGGPGGTGGNAGSPGNPGEITLQTSTPFPDSIQLSLTSNPGHEGKPGQGGAGGPGGLPGPPEINPQYTSSGWWWNRSHDITSDETAESKCRKSGKQGDQGRMGGATKEFIPPSLPIACTVPISYVWGHVMPKSLVGRMLQVAETLYQERCDAAGYLLSFVSSAATLQQKTGRSIEPVARRASLLSLQHKKGFCYWGYRDNFYPLQPFSTLRSRVEDMLHHYESAYEAWASAMRKEGRETVLSERLHGAHEVSVESSKLLEGKIRDFRRLEADCLASIDRLNLSSSLAKKSLSAQAEALTKAVAHEATQQAVRNFTTSDHAERFSKAVTVLSTMLSVYPALPPPPSIIDTLVAQGRDPGEATGAYYKMAQESFISIGAQLISSAREFFRDDDAIKQKTEEALSQIILESQQDKSTMPLHEVDRWVAGVGLTGERVKVRDKYLSEVRRYQAVLTGIEEEGKKLEAVRGKLEEMESGLEKSEGEKRMLSDSRGRLELLRMNQKINDHLWEAVWNAAKKLGWGFRLLTLAASRLTGKKTTLCTI